MERCEHCGNEKHEVVVVQKKKRKDHPLKGTEEMKEKMAKLRANIKKKKQVE